MKMSAPRSVMRAKPISIAAPHKAQPTIAKAAMWARAPGHQIPLSPNTYDNRVRDEHRSIRSKPEASITLTAAEATKTAIAPSTPSA
jgi:hypothetical protein